MRNGPERKEIAEQEGQEPSLRTGEDGYVGV
jgi:hypothetical protein